MSLEIEGLSGHKLDVTSRNMARTLALALSPQAEVTLSQARTWTIFDTQTPTGAADYFFYMLNGSVRDILVTRVYVSAGTLEQVRVQSVTGTAAGGTTVSTSEIGNRTVGSGRLPASTVDLQVGANITGLTASNTYERIVVAANGENNRELVDRPIIVRPNSAIALLADVGAIALDFAVDIVTQVIDPEEVV